MLQTMESEEANVFPLADDSLCAKILNFIKLANDIKQLKKGANEVTKTLCRGNAEFIVMAADVDPMGIIAHLPLLCEDKNVPYVYVRSKQALGRACGVSRDVVACVILMQEGSQLKPQATLIQKEIDRLLI